MAHVAEWKKEEVNELKSLIDKYDVIGIVELVKTTLLIYQSIWKVKLQLLQLK